MDPRRSASFVALCSAAGLFFSAWSTSDFVQHLDRQTHALHCSFVPGLSALDASADSGCHVALFSPYSSVFRTTIWGGVPATLAGMAVFAYLAYRAIRLILEDRMTDPTSTRYLLLATLLPVFTSLGYGWIAVTELEALCKLCLGIYLSSAGAFAGAFWLDRLATQAASGGEAPAGPLRADLPATFGLGLLEGIGFVVFPVALYVWMAPDFSDRVGACGELARPGDASEVLVPIGAHRGGRDAIEVFDPLCPSCKGFEERLASSGLAPQLDRKAVLFPLDSACNWMIDQSLHPGACVVSEAILCAGGEADAVIGWAFEHQAEVRAAAAKDDGAAAKMVGAAFPKLASCIGSDKVRQRLNRSLRWAVANQLPVLTPQLYVEGRKLCDEDTDLGLDWTLARLLELPPATKKGVR
jgi:uncharacterized membrane protein